MVFGALLNIFRGGTTPRDAAETRRPSKKKSKKRKRRRRRRDGDAAERRVGRDGGDDEATRGHIREGSAGPDGDARDAPFRGVSVSVAPPPTSFSFFGFFF